MTKVHTIRNLIYRRKELLREINEIENQLGEIVLNMPEDVIQLVTNDVIKFNFPLPDRIKSILAQNKN